MFTCENVLDIIFGKLTLEPGLGAEECFWRNMADGYWTTFNIRYLGVLPLHYNLRLEYKKIIALDVI